jgi:pyruvate kinase
MGITVPGGFEDLPAMTERDLAHLQVAVLYADWIALSFVRHANDVRLLRDALKIRGCNARIIAKIERAAALNDLEEIVGVSDGVMVARGDLGVEIGLAAVPFAQARIISCAQEHAKTVITATQVLESMITADAPTRAEAADIARALIEGTSALMLSAETATGAHPVLVVQTMAELILAAEQHLQWEPRQIPDYDNDRASLVHAADRLAADQQVEVVLIPTDTGRTARMASALARQHLVALCPDPRIRRQLALERGVITVDWDGEHGDYLPVTVLRHAVEQGLADAGQRVVVVWSHTHNSYDNPMQLVAALKL